MSDEQNQPTTTPQGEPSVDPQSIEGLFLTALTKAKPDEREHFLNEVCAGDHEKRQRLEALLRAYHDAGSFFEKPPIATQTFTESQNFDFLEPADGPSLLGLLGTYEIYELIGRGGMGIVFRARDPKLNRIVAVKVLAPELAANPNAKRRFVREAQSAASINHPHVITIHAVDDEGKLPFLVMECIVGQSLQQKIDTVGSLRLLETLRISKQISEGLSAAHHQGLIHRDIKPANILLENGVERVKITDFGLARTIDDVSVTRTGEVAGSPQFMSPEQARGERVDHRSDLFSLGCVMYAMCAGRSPFRATSIAAAIRRVCDDEPRSLAEINPEVPEWLIAVIQKLLHKNPDHRFQSADEVVQTLEAHLAGIGNTKFQPAKPDEANPAMLGPVIQPAQEAKVDEPPPLLGSLASTFLRLALLGPLIIVSYLFLCVIFEREIDPQLIPYAVGMLGSILWGAALIGWLGSSVDRTDWGLEAIFKGRIASLLALVTPPFWILGIPSGMVAWWVLKQPPVQELYRSRKSGETLSIPIPSSLLDLGVLLGAGLTSLVVLLIYHTEQFTFPDLLEAMPVVVAASLLILPLRGNLFRGRFWRDSAISLSAVSFVAALFLIEQSGFPPQGAVGQIETVSAMLILGAMLILPGIAIWKLVRTSWQNTSDHTQIRLISLADATSGRRPARTARRVVGISLILAVAVFQALSWSVQTAAPVSSVIIHHPGTVKPVSFEIDGASASPRQQTDSRTILDIQPGEHSLKILMKGEHDAETHREEYKLNVQTGDQIEIDLRLPVILDAGMELGPATKDYGGLILDIPEAGLQVMLLSTAKNDPGFLQRLIPAGIHQVPAGDYLVVAVDTQAGWLIDVKEDSRNEQSYAAVYQTMSRFYQGVEQEQKFYDQESGTWSIVQYQIGPISIEAGQFASLEVHRDLAAISRQQVDFAPGKFYRFLWKGKKYSFTVSQAIVINQLLKAYAQNEPEVPESELLNSLPAEDSAPVSVKQLFLDGRHPAWSEILILRKPQDEGLHLSLVPLNARQTQVDISRLAGEWIAIGTEDQPEPETVLIESPSLEPDDVNAGWLRVTFTDVGGNRRQGTLGISPANQYFTFTVRHEDRSRHEWGGTYHLDGDRLDLEFKGVNVTGSRSQPVNWSRISEYEFSPGHLQGSTLNLKRAIAD